MSRSTGRVGVVLCALAACLCMPADGMAAKRKAPPKPIALNAGWQIRDAAAAAPAPQPAPPGESEEGQENRRRSCAGAEPRQPAGTSLAARPGARRVRRGRRPQAVRRHGQGVQAALPRAQDAGLQMGAALRAGPPPDHRDPQRPPDRRQHRPLHAFRARGEGPAPRPGERAAGHRGQPQGPAPARGMVELGRDHAPGDARPARAGEHRRPGPALRRAAASGPATSCAAKVLATGDPVQAPAPSDAASCACAGASGCSRGGCPAPSRR